MSKKGGSAPPPPDPYATADAQSRYNKDTALYNAMLNRVDTYTPLGSQTYQITGKDPVTGAPTYRQDINLTPQGQELYDQQRRQDLALGNVAQGMLGQVGSSYQNAINTQGLPGLYGGADLSKLPGLIGGGDLTTMRQNAQDALYANNTRYLDRQYDRAEDQLRTRLYNQGITDTGSEAWRNAMADFNQSKEQAYNAARNDAISGAGTEAQRLFGLSAGARQQLLGEQLQNSQFGNQARGQGLSELLALRNQPLNEFNALRSASQVQMPSFQGMYMGGAGAPDYQGAVNTAYQGQLNAYNAQQAGSNSLLGGLFGLGGTLGAAKILASDRRVKREIVRVGVTSSGLPTYTFRYVWDAPTDPVRWGVMADEVEAVMPDAVVDLGGVKGVDYSRVLEAA